LTLGFARRFVAYKRVDLLLRDPERLVRILTNSQQPVQLVLAGKAPPSDGQGRDLIRRWNQFIRQYKMYAHVIFMEDYDMLLAAHMVQGVDVWINTPRRPWEASGTSGMKVLVNGGINLSELDGWWVEAYTPEVGWALGDGQEHGDDPRVDEQEAQDLYHILEQEVIPLFYNRTDQQIPSGWVQKMRQSMATLTPHYSANRTVREYTENFYIPGTQHYQTRAANGGELGKKIVQWEQAMNQGFPSLRFGDLKWSQVNDEYHFDVPVYLDGLNPAYVKVQLYANGQHGAPDVQADLQPAGQGDAHSFTLYTGTAKADRPATDYTPRLLPFNDQLNIPLEYKKILWQH
jgi:starch phosphorylase